MNHFLLRRSLLGLALATAAGSAMAQMPAKLQATAKSPTAQRMLKYAFNLTDDGMVGQQLFAGEATRLAYGSEEAKEGRDAFLEKRPADPAKIHGA